MYLMAHKSVYTAQHTKSKETKMGYVDEVLQKKRENA